MLLTKEMTAWILKRLNSRDSAEFMLALSLGKPLSPEQEVGIIHVDYDKHTTTIYDKDGEVIREY